MENDLQIGDIITTYHKGYHKIVGFNLDENYKTINNIHISNPQVFYEKVLDINFKKSGKINNSCHIDYCKKITLEDFDEIFKKEEERISLGREAVKKLFGEKNGN